MQILTGAGLSTSAGLNTYIPFIVLGIMGRLDILNLNNPYNLFEKTYVIAIFFVLFVVEFIGDKIPYLVHIFDVINTPLRFFASALLFLASTSGANFIDSDIVNIIIVVMAALFGAFATVLHVIRAVFRLFINHVTFNLSNPVVSLLEDVFSLLLCLFAFMLPPLVIAGVIGLIIFIWLRVFRNYSTQVKKNQLDPKFKANTRFWQDSGLRPGGKVVPIFQGYKPYSTQATGTEAIKPGSMKTGGKR